MLLHIVSMLTKLGRRDHELGEEPTRYGDYNNDNDYDNEEDRESHPPGAG